MEKLRKLKENVDAKLNLFGEAFTELEVNSRQEVINLNLLQNVTIMSQSRPDLNLETVDYFFARKLFFFFFFLISSHFIAAWDFCGSEVHAS